MDSWTRPLPSLTYTDKKVFCVETNLYLNLIFLFPKLSLFSIYGYTAKKKID